jgi:hypothetical protein
MRLTELLLFGLAAWTGLGLLGVWVSSRRGEKRKVRLGMAWLLGVWVVYLCILVGVSLAQKQRVVAIGQDQCFGEMCFAVTGVDEVPGFLIRDGRRLLRVSVRVSNKGRAAQSEELIQAYLVDARGRRWDQSAGVNGVRLTARVAGGDSAVSEPVFKVAADATGLALVFSRGWRQPGAFVIGDSDSLLHRRTVVPLGR